MIKVNLPKVKDEEVTGLFEDYFQLYDAFEIGDGLIASFIHKNKLASCPVNMRAKYVLSNMWTKGILMFKKTHVTIKKL